MPDWVQQLLVEAKATPRLEWIGLAFGVAEVLLARANKAALYPCGIISVVISSWIFFHSKLYAESLLNIYYLVMSIYGWWMWRAQAGTRSGIKIMHANKQDWLISAGIVAGGFLVLYFALITYTDSTVPAWDAFVSATAWAGMWLLARRKVENWLLLNLSNAFAVPLMFYKGLPLYGLLYLFLFIVAVAGYFDWRKIAAEQIRIASPPNPE